MPGGPHLRKLGLAHLPPKVPPGSGLPDGAIAATYTRGVRQGDYMIRLEALSIHTCLVPRSAARRLARDAQAGTKRRVHFVITEQVRCRIDILACAASSMQHMYIRALPRAELPRRLVGRQDGRGAAGQPARGRHALQSAGALRGRS